MALRPFLAALHESGRVRVARPPEPPEVEQAGVAEILTHWDLAVRRELAFTPPAFSLPAASWAALRLYRACQFLVFRDLSAAIVEDHLATACPEPCSPSVVYSADLTLRFLPDVISLARGIATGDPLVDALHRLARAWPLSSVGCLRLEPVDPSPFLDHPCLRRLYVDRILERRDTSRLDHPSVRAAVREALGLFPELCPEIASALRAEPVEKTS